MSTIQVAPTSFWSMLPQITSNAIGQYNTSQDRGRAEQDRQRQMLLQQLGILQTSAANGADVNDQISSLMGKLGMSGVTPAQTPAQLRQQIMNTPDMKMPDATPQVIDPSTGQTTQASGGSVLPPSTVSGLDKFTDTQRAVAGVQTRGQVAQDQTSQAVLGNTKTIADIKARAAAGQPVTPMEAQLAGIATPSQLAMKNSSDVLDFVNKSAPGYVDEWLLKNGNRIKTQGKGANTDQIIDQAYGAFKERYGDKIPDGDDTNARSAFAGALTNALHDQDTLDLKRQEMQLQLAVANIRKAGKTNDPELTGKLVDQINGVANGLEKQLDAIPKVQQQLFMTKLMQGIKPDPNAPPSDMYNQFVQTQTRLTAARSAAASAARGLTDDPQTQKFLDIASGVAQLNTQPPATGPAPNVVKKAPDGRSIITEDMKAYLQAKNQWNPAKYVVQ